MLDVTAVVLCGGKGERLKPVTESIPKSLIPLNGVPLLEHLMRYLSASGIAKIVACVGYKAAAIEEFVSGLDLPSEIVCVNSGDASMTDRILDARKHIRNRALVCYGDTLANVDLAQLSRFHRERQATATVTVYPMQSPFGIVDVNGEGQVGGFREKPVLPYFINIGYLLCEPHALDQIQKSSGIPAFLTVLQEQGGLFAYRHTGRHLTVNTEKDRRVAEAEVTEFYTVMDPVDLSGRAEL